MKLDDLRKLAVFESCHTQEDLARLHEHLLAMGIDPSKLYQELEMSSRFVNAHRDTSFPQSLVSLHSHNFYEVLFCRSDSGVEYLVGSDRYRLRPGDIVFVPPGVSHRPILPEQMSAPYVRDVLWISPELLFSLKGSFPYPLYLQETGYSLIRTADTRWEFLGELFQNAVQEEQLKRPCWETVVLGHAITILSYLDRAYTEHSAAMLRAEKPELSDNVTAYIEAHFTEHISVSDLARRFFVSDSSISHQFKQKMGISIYHYVTQRRLIYAKNLISEGVALEQIATRVGFSDYSAFYRAFKQEYGISPRQYRQKIL